LGDSAFGADFKLLSICEGKKANISSNEFLHYQAWRKSLPGYLQMAIVAPTDYEYGIARMYELATNEVGTKAMRAFRILEGASEWLGLPD
jgi:hypothetical protein